MLNRFESKDIVNIAAGSAADATVSYYEDVKNFNRFLTQLNWTAGSGGGTISVTVYATTLPFADAEAAKNGDTGDVFQDVSLPYFGATTISGDSLILDDGKVLSGVSFLKFAVTIANKDESTAYRLRLTKVGE